jgi:putative glycosyltransferase (TIGR04348 family)
VHRRNIVIVTPALADANNGNWQTARRWRQMLRPAYRVRLTAVWPDSGAADADLMIALHARRSAPSIAAWRAARARQPLLLVLTGTDLYRDIAADADAQRSLHLADRLVVLNDLGARSLPVHLQPKARVLLQSCPARQLLPKPQGHLRAVMVGHLRAEKDPLTFLHAAQRLAHRPDIRLDHIGRALDAALGLQAAALAAAQPGYRWLGGLPHGATRRRIQQAHLLVHPSRIEGGAHVVIEALRSGTPVLASAIDGNLGLLGADWPGLFAPGDDAALAALLQRCRDDPAMLPALCARAAALAPRFAPAAESATLHTLVADLLAAHAPSGEPP